MIVSGLLWLGLVGQQAPLLLDKSSYLADVKSWFGKTYQIADYHWLAPNTILYLTKDSGQHFAFQTFNVSTKTTNDSGLTKAYNSSNGGFDNISVSPNGQRIFWSGWDGKQSKWFVANVDGSNLASCDRRMTSMVLSNHGPDDETTLSWGPDSKTVYESVIEFGDGTSTLLWSRSIVSLDKEETLPTAKGYVDWQPSIIRPELAFATSGLAIGSERNSAGFITWNIHNPKKTRREWTVTVPSHRTIGAFSHSHDGNRMLWNLSVHDSKNKDPWNVTGEEIWMTDWAGKDWTLVARIPFAKDKTDEEWSQMSSVKWLPGDKTFSFVFRRKLYQYKLP